jgi:NTE family protein
MAARDIRKINVALQGGGSHGAYTWGVLDRLLADDCIKIEAVSGTSAGAMNAVVMAEGLVEGGRVKAREQLADFWQRVAYRLPPGAPGWDRSWTKTWEQAWGLDQGLGPAMISWWTQLASPYDFNPLNINPLRDALLREVDFDRVKNCKSLKLFVTATNVRTGQIKVFSGNEITADAVMASACLPSMFQAVEIGREFYWDGGYMGNPAIKPFFRNCDSSDVLLVQLNPIQRPEIPRTAWAISNRVNEISFNGPLLAELKQVEFVNKRLDLGEMQGTDYRQIFLHRVGGGDDLSTYPASSKLDSSIELITELRNLGYKAMDQWLTDNREHLGQVSTLPLSELTGE